jgi:hypothetical protein
LSDLLQLEALRRPTSRLSFCTRSTFGSGRSGRPSKACTATSTCLTGKHPPQLAPFVLQPDPDVSDAYRDTISHLVSMASCLVSHAVASDTVDGLFGAASTSDRNNNFDAFASKHTCVYLSVRYHRRTTLTLRCRSPLVFSSFELGHNSTALLHFNVILDPLSETAQRWSTTLKVSVCLGSDLKGRLID